MNNYLERSYPSYSKRSLLEIYLVVATITIAAVVGISLLGKDVEIINGSRFVIDTPGGLDHSATANASQWFGSGFIGWVRLRPVRDHTEIEAKAPLIRSRDRETILGRLPIRPIFGERDLMEKLILTKDHLWGYGNFFYQRQYRKDVLCGT